jgi:hypothetical protein
MVIKWMAPVLTRAKEDVQLGIIPAIFNFFNGRATFFALVFTTTGIILAFRGKLTADFVALVTAIQGLVFSHSLKEDIHEERMARLEREGRDSDGK